MEDQNKKIPHKELFCLKMKQNEAKLASKTISSSVWNALYSHPTQQMFALQLNVC